MINSKNLLSNTTSKVGQTLIWAYKSNLVLDLSYLLFRNLMIHKSAIFLPALILSIF